MECLLRLKGGKKRLQPQDEVRFEIPPSMKKLFESFTASQIPREGAMIRCCGWIHLCILESRNLRMRSSVWDYVIVLK